MANRQITAIDRHVGKRIKAARLAANLSQTELGKKLGITFQQVQKYENGKNRISIGKLAVIADLLHLTVPWFLEGAPGLAATADMNGHADASDIVTSLLTLPHGADLARDYAAIGHNADRDVVVRVARALAARTHEPVEA